MANMSEMDRDQLWEDWKAFKPKVLSSDNDPVKYDALLKGSGIKDARGWTLEEDTSLRNRLEDAGWGFLLPKFKEETPAPQSWGEASNPYLAKNVQPRKTGLTRAGRGRILET